MRILRHSAAGQTKLPSDLTSSRGRASETQATYPAHYPPCCGPRLRRRPLLRDRLTEQCDRSAAAPRAHGYAGSRVGLQRVATYHERLPRIWPSRPRWSMHDARRTLMCSQSRSFWDRIVSLLLRSLNTWPARPPLMLERCHEAFGKIRRWRG